jgi:hypothetical protein
MPYVTAGSGLSDVLLGIRVVFSTGVGPCVHGAGAGHYSAMFMVAIENPEVKNQCEQSMSIEYKPNSVFLRSNSYPPLYHPKIVVIGTTIFLAKLNARVEDWALAFDNILVGMYRTNKVSAVITRNPKSAESIEF